MSNYVLTNIKLLLLVIVIVLLSVGAIGLIGSANAKGYNVITVKQDFGGEVSRYENEIDIVNRNSFYAITGQCFSACTMRLARGCIYPHAVLGFHSPYAVGPDANSFEAKVEISRSRAALINHYPPGIRKWAEDNRVLLSNRKNYLSGSQAIALGVPDCRTMIQGELQ